MDREDVFRAIHRSFTVDVTGVGYPNRDGTSRQDAIGRCREGDDIQLARESDNPHDPNAIAVLRQNGEQLGYVPADSKNLDLEALAQYMDWGLAVHASICRMWKGHTASGCDIEINRNATAEEEENERITAMIKKARALEEESPEQATRLYRDATQAIVELDNRGPYGKWCRQAKIPVGRWSMLLEKHKQLRGCLKLLRWYERYQDHVGINKATQGAIEKPKARLGKKRTGG